MYKLSILWVWVMLYPVVAFAQGGGGKITGTITDAIDKKPLEGATLSALYMHSGLFITHSVSDRDGSFVLRGLPLNDSLEIVVSYTGYRDTSTYLVLTAEKKSISSSIWKLRSGEQLDTVVITHRRAPFVIHNDTIEFNATAFKSLPHDLLQDLLRKLPGIVLDKDGNITVNGQKVTRIKVDGRDFFGSNLKIATGTLPVDMIDKIQVTESREPYQLRNSAIMPLQKEITVNVLLKKSKHRRVFGEAGSGYGTSNRFREDLNLNLFDSVGRYSLFGDFGNEGGLSTTTGNAGVNYTNDIGRRTNIAMHYLGATTNSSTQDLLKRTNILPDSVFEYNSAVETKGQQYNHSLQATLNIKPDTLQQLVINPSIQFSDDNKSNRIDANSMTLGGQVMNSQQTMNQSRDRAINFSNVTNYTWSSANRHTTVTAMWQVGFAKGKGMQVNRSLNAFGEDRDSIDQYGASNNDGISNAVVLQVNQRINQRLNGILQYQWHQNRADYIKDIYDYNVISGKHDLIDSAFTNHTRTLNELHQLSWTTGYSTKKLIVEAAVDLRWMRLDNTLLLKDSAIHLPQHNVTPRLSTSYALSKRSRVVVAYKVNRQVPTADQLALRPDNSNPFYIRVGNPLLKSSMFHFYSGGLEWTSRDLRSRLGMGASGMVAKEAIVEQSCFDSVGRQVSSFANVNGVRQVGLRLGGGSRWVRGQWTFNLDAGLSLGRNVQVGFVNSTENVTKSLSSMGQLNAVVQYGALLFVYVNSGLAMNSTTYSISSLQQLKYNTIEAQLGVKYIPSKRFVIDQNLSYTYNSQLGKEFGRTRLLWYVSVGYSFLGSERLQLAVNVNDVLNRNITSSQSVTPTAIEWSQTRALRRYAMLVVKYRLNESN